MNIGIIGILGLLWIVRVPTDCYRLHSLQVFARDSRNHCDMKKNTSESISMVARNPVSPHTTVWVPKNR